MIVITVCEHEYMNMCPPNYRCPYANSISWRKTLINRSNLTTVELSMFWEHSLIFINTEVTFHENVCASCILHRFGVVLVIYGSDESLSWWQESKTALRNYRASIATTSLILEGILLRSEGRKSKYLEKTLKTQKYKHIWMTRNKVLVCLWAEIKLCNGKNVWMMSTRCRLCDSYGIIIVYQPGREHWEYPKASIL